MVGIEPKTIAGIAAHHIVGGGFRAMTLGGALARISVVIA